MVILYYTFKNDEKTYLNFTAKLTIGVTTSQKHIQYSVNKVEIKKKNKIAQVSQYLPFVWTVPWAILTMQKYNVFLISQHFH